MAQPADEPVVMVNNLKFTEDGAQSYRRYAKAAGLARCGSYADPAPSQVIGDGEKPRWDIILPVEYP